MPALVPTRMSISAIAAVITTIGRSSLLMMPCSFEQMSASPCVRGSSGTARYMIVRPKADMARMIP